MADEQQAGGDGSEQPRPTPPRPPQGSGGTPPMTPTRMRLGTGRSGGGTPAPRPSGTAPAGQQAAEASGALPAEQTPVEMTRPATTRPSPAEQAATDAPAPAPAAPGAPDPAAAARDAAYAAQAERAIPARGGPGGPAATRPAAPATRPAAAAPAAVRPAAAAGAARPAAGATTERLAAAVSREPAPARGGGAQAESLVYVWPHLVTIEFVSALLMMLSLILLSWVVNSPLEAHANPDRTPNPSKAPWYFLNLQELLLHMHPALAGVIVPSGALAAIAAIPYFDRDQSDVGKWFGTRNAIPIVIFVSIYTTVVEVAQIFFDELIGVKPMMNALAQTTGIGYFNDSAPFGIAALSMPDTIVPSLMMLGPIAPMMFVIHKIWKPNTREVMIALFTGFFVSYIILTIFGTFFRGQGMHLCWLTDPCQIRID